jgi:hypothetical protein
MPEVGVDFYGQKPKVLTAEVVRASGHVISMCCGGACRVFPGKKYLETRSGPASGP